MTRRIIGSWADALPASERAPAIAALGVVVGVWGELDLSSADLIASGFKAELEKAKGLRTAPRRLVWWLSPSDHWESLKQRLAPHIAAQAWTIFVKANGPVELQAGYAGPDDEETFTEFVPWLAELLWSREAGVRSLFFQSGESKSRRSWHWPLRLGFLPDGASQDLMEEFARNGPGWSNMLTRSIDVVGSGQGCDLLLSPLDAAETRALVDRHKIRATTIVLLDRKPFTTVQDARAFRALKTAARAAAIASISNSRKARTITGIIEALSHNEPFDWAVSFAAREDGGIPLIVADAEFIYHSHIGAVGDRWAARLYAQREPGDLATRARLADEIRQINKGDFFSELNEASQLAEKTNEALVGSEPQPRYLAATLQPVEALREARMPTTPATTLVHNQWRLLVVNIAPRSGPQALPAFPDARIDWTQDQQTLSIVVTAPNCDLLPRSEPFLFDLLRQRGSPSSADVARYLELVGRKADEHPRDAASTQVTIRSIGSSDDAVFLIRPRAAGSLRARILVVHANRVLQTAILEAEVAGEEPAEASGVARSREGERGESEGIVRLVPEGMIRSEMQDLEERRIFDLAILTNDSLTGASQGTVMSDGKVSLEDFGEVKKVADRIGTRLKEMVESPKDFRGPHSDAMVSLLRTLANDGVLIRRHLRDAGLGPILDSNPGRIQIVAAKPDEALPVEFIYDGKAPDPNSAEICPNQAKALGDPLCKTCETCPFHEKSTHVCAMRFWGLSKVIERHIFGKKKPSVAGKDELTARTPSLGGDSIKRPAMRLFASSHRAEDFPGGPDALRDIVQRLKGSSQPPATALSASGWKEWRSYVQQSAPSLCVLLPHTDVDNGNDVIEIGVKDVLTNAQIDEDLVGTNHPVIVVLLGCATAAPQLRLASFVAAFRAAKAEVVIGTLTPVLGRHAAPVAKALIEQLDQFWDGSRQAVTVGDALTQVRRKFMAEGLPIGLTLVAFGDADWLLG